MSDPNPLYTTWKRKEFPIVPSKVAKQAGISQPHIYRILFYTPRDLARCSLLTLLNLEKTTGVDLISFVRENLN